MVSLDASPPDEPGLHFDGEEIRNGAEPKEAAVIPFDHPVFNDDKEVLDALQRAACVLRRLLALPPRQQQLVLAIMREPEIQQIELARRLGVFAQSVNASLRSAKRECPALAAVFPGNRPRARRAAESS